MEDSAAVEDKVYKNTEHVAVIEEEGLPKIEIALIKDFPAGYTLEIYSVDKAIVPNLYIKEITENKNLQSFLNSGLCLPNDIEKIGTCVYSIMKEIQAENRMNIYLGFKFWDYFTKEEATKTDLSKRRFRW